MKRTFWFQLILLLVLIPGCGGDVRDRTYTGVLEGTTVQVPALTPGKLLDVFVNTGDEVGAGDVLAVIDTTELILQREQFAAALDEVSVQEEIARTNMGRSKKDLDYVRERMSRGEKLFKEQAASQQNLDDLHNELQRAESAYETSRQQVSSLEARKRQLKAQVNTVRKKIGDAVITAPMDALVGTVYYEPGEAVGTYQPVAELIHVRELDVKIYVSEKKLPELKPGDEVRIRVDGLKEELPGRVSWISPKAEFTPKTILTPETRTSLVFAVKVTVPNPKRVLKHGMPVEVIVQ